MMNWNDLENLAEAGMPLLVCLLGNQAGSDELLEEYGILNPDQAIEVHRKIGRAMEQKPIGVRYRNLCQYCGEAGSLLLACAMTCALHPHLEGRLLECCEGGCSFSVAGLLNTAYSYGELWEAYQRLSELLPVREPEEPMFFRKSFYLDQRLLNHLAGVDALAEELQRFAVPADPKEELQALYIDEELVSRLGNMLKEAYPIQLVGESGRGKKLLLRHALASAGIWGIFADGRILAQEKNILPVLWRMRREAILLDGVICIYGIDEEWLKNCSISLLSMIRQYFQNLSLCVCTERGLNLTDGQNGDWNRLELPVLHQEEHIALWKGYCQQLNVVLDPRRLGSKYHMTPAQIAKVARRIAQAEVPTPQVLLQACMDVLPAAGNNVKQMQTSYTFDDLKVKPQTREVLDNICSHVNYREQVYGQWGLESRYAYGRSVSALFSGSPGTGKTMAAHVLSSALSLPLYCVNLSQIVDKYIGETEKKLEQVFTLAEKSNTILFFDEADSLFGKRSEVNDAKDRYANIEVSYILQRMEQYDGIVILATNHRNNIDEAFLRRIRYAAEFSMPDEDLRREIWKGCFSSQTPLFEVDFDFIAREFEFSGGDIKNIALNAAFLAAQEESAWVGMEHILRSIQMEYSKANRILPRSSLGEYGTLLLN